jgi:hypothetical protein
VNLHPRRNQREIEGGAELPAARLGWIACDLAFAVTIEPFGEEKIRPAETLNVRRPIGSPERARA